MQRSVLEELRDLDYIEADYLCSEGAKEVELLDDDDTPLRTADPARLKLPHGTRQLLRQGSSKADGLADGATLARDHGNGGRTLGGFAALKSAAGANLSEAEVLALRALTGPCGGRVEEALRSAAEAAGAHVDVDGGERLLHHVATTVACAWRAVEKLAHAKGATRSLTGPGGDELPLYVVLEGDAAGLAAASNVGAAWRDWGDGMSLLCRGFVCRRL